MTYPSFRDIEQLSAYLDGQLSPQEKARLESRLARDPQLHAAMDDLNQARALLRQLPARRVPRNFTLTPKMAGIKPPLPRPYPALRWASVLATLLLIFTFVTNAFITNTFVPTFRAAQQAYGMGGGGGVETMVTTPEVSPAEPSLQMAAPPGETQTPAEDQRMLGTPEPGLTEKSLAPEEVTPQPSSLRPVPLAWQIGLLILALTSAGMAWILRLASERTWREKMK